MPIVHINHLVVPRLDQPPTKFGTRWPRRWPGGARGPRRSPGACPDRGDRRG